MDLQSANKVFGGWVRIYQHQSEACRCPMRFGVFTPDGKEKGGPAVMFLSGLTCTEQNFLTKSGAFAAAAEHGLSLIVPDTSPRGCNLPGEEDSWDFGTGAGFYLNATTPGFGDHYRMYDYIVDELPSLVAQELGVDLDRLGISGHSMGGHGALTIALKNRDRFRSVSAFAPICHPSKCPWGEKAFTGYLGEDRGLWKAYDATELLKSGGAAPWPILIDQGGDDEFLEVQLNPAAFCEAAEQAGQKLEYNLREGYDHSYYFISTFIGDHLAWHSRLINHNGD